jgi:hypothetical protein
VVLPPADQECFDRLSRLIYTAWNNAYVLSASRAEGRVPIWIRKFLRAHGLVRTYPSEAQAFELVDAAIKSNKAWLDAYTAAMQDVFSGSLKALPDEPMFRTPPVLLIMWNEMREWGLEEEDDMEYDSQWEVEEFLMDVDEEEDY